MTKITRSSFGVLHGKELSRFTLENEKGMKLDITDYGGTILSAWVPDKNNVLADVVLGYANIEGIRTSEEYFGAIIGRHANRIGGATINLNGVEYPLTVGANGNQLHGGNEGFDKKVWSADVITGTYGECLKLTYSSADMEEGFPGKLDVTVVYSLSENNEINMDYKAVSDKDTICNLTNHAYFNLAGHDSGSALNHEITIHADRFTVVRSGAIPTGELRDVSGSAFDLRTPVRIGDRIDADDEQLHITNGFDHNFVIRDDAKTPNACAELYDSSSGRVLKVFTDMPGVQFYSGNFLKTGHDTKNGVFYGKNAGICLETQFYPDSIHFPDFPSPVLKTGVEYHSTTIYAFSAR